MTCPAGVIANGQLFRCDRELGHDKMHYSTAAGASLWWWGAVEAAEIEGAGLLPDRPGTGDPR